MIFHQPGYTNMSVEYQSEYFVCKLIMSVYGLLFKVSFIANRPTSGESATLYQDGDTESAELRRMS